ncbi:MAG TPA: LytTR family DNA-binding domain-containing protein [Pseudogracilibacillus sp.]|nr:LytTR family DNA-binding domain-containing protein [Pseudogracilibacillus sp.]
MCQTTTYTIYCRPVMPSSAPLMSKVLTETFKPLKIDLKEGLLIRENMNIHLHIDQAKEMTEININTYDRKTGEDILRHLRQYTVPSAQKLGVKTADGILMIHKTEILFAEIFGKQLSITTKEETITTRMTLSALQRTLSNPNVIQTTKSSIVNITFIKKVDPSFSGNLTATLTNGKKISISRRYVKNVNQALGL